jgi:hypothetical protein
MWLHCKAIFQKDYVEELEKLGLEVEDWKDWTDFSIHTSRIEAFNQSSQKECCTVRFSGDSFTLNIPYAEMKRILDPAKEGLHFTDEPALNA